MPQSVLLNFYLYKQKIIWKHDLSTSELSAMRYLFNPLDHHHRSLILIRYIRFICITLSSIMATTIQQILKRMFSNTHWRSFLKIDSQITLEKPSTRKKIQKRSDPSNENLLAQWTMKINKKHYVGSVIEFLRVMSGPGTTTTKTTTTTTTATTRRAVNVSAVPLYANSKMLSDPQHV